MLENKKDWEKKRKGRNLAMDMPTGGPLWWIQRHCEKRDLYKFILDAQWIDDTKKDHLCKVALCVSLNYLDLHKERKSPHSALLYQLRKRRIGFNKILSNRRVPGVVSARWDCGASNMTVHQELFQCPRLSEERKKLWSCAEWLDRPTWKKFWGRDLVRRQRQSGWFFRQRFWQATRTPALERKEG